MIPTDDLEGGLRGMYQNVGQATPPYRGGPPVEGRGEPEPGDRRRRGRRIAVAAAASVALLCATIALFASIAPSNSPSANEPDAAALAAPTVGLLVAPPSEGTLQALVEGRLDVNANGCVTVDGRLLLASHGARLAPDGAGVEFPNAGTVDFGSVVRGSGGYVTVSAADVATISDPFGCLKTLSGPLEVTALDPE
ncbi:hypothetical protein RB608_17920 [Nocardioides sp. LHD-245]|uniref:hypothetical protein n=1 Tax=Nocardioides sp. LHD-245 TaxID=3051387 RepID=UPI0027E109E3|nr:hypothetical protein [Nocardioides sp. LHD-245]